MSPGPSEESTPRAGRLTWALVVLITVVAAGLRAWEIGRHAMWVDELYSMETSAAHGMRAHWELPRGIVGGAPDLTGLESAGPWWSVPLVMGNDTHPPLYFVLLRGWREVFGSTEPAARALAVLAGVAGIPLLFLLGRGLLGTAPALWACAIYAVAGPQIQLAQEIRGYTLLAALTLAAALLVVRIERRGGTRGRYVMLSLCTCAMLLTHYFSGGVIAGIALYALIWLRGPARRATVGAVVAGGALFALTWGPMMWRQFRDLGHTNDWVLEAREGSLGRTLRRVAQLPVRYLNEPMQSSAALTAAAGGLLYVIPAIVLRRRPELLLPYLVFVTTVAFVAAQDGLRAAKQLEFVRYTLPAAPFVYLILAGLVPRGRVLRHALPAVAVASCLVSLPRAYAYVVPAKPDWRWVTAQLTRDGPVETLVLLGPGEHAWITSNYLALQYYLRPAPVRVVVLDDPTAIPPETAAELRAAGGPVWAFSLPARPAVLPTGFQAERIIHGPAGVALKLRPVD